MATKKKIIPFKIEIDPHFKAEITKEYKDGSAQLTITYDDHFKKAICKTMGWKQATKNRIEKLILKAIDEMMGIEEK